MTLGKENKQMLSHLYLLINEGLLAIPEKYEKLILTLRPQGIEFTAKRTNKRLESSA